jgi:hypothetical protein
VSANIPGGSGSAVSNEILVQPPVAPATPAAGGAVAACRLDYQRADNMWAAFGGPRSARDRVRLAGGRPNKVFITD